MKRIIVNGANGFVASNFINDLLKNDYEVVALVRGNGKLSARERVEQSLMQVNRGQLPDIENLSVYNYSLLEKDYALPQTHLNKIFEKEADFFHFAASLKYDQKSKEEIYSTNVEGVDNSVRVFKQYAQGASRFFLVGTAYSCGHINEVFEERFYPDMDVSAFRNYYEWSKRLAENILGKYIERDHLRGHIIRLSQVAGNNKTGEARTDYGIFDFAKRVHRLAKRYPGQTIRAKVAPEGTQNLIPVNTVVDYLMQTIQQREVPVIMNFVARKPVKNRYVISSLNKLIPLTILPVPGLEHSDMNSLERLMAVGMSFTGSYSNLDIRFDTSKRDEMIVQGEDQMDEETVFKMLSWFMENVCEKSEKKESVLIGK